MAISTGSVFTGPADLLSLLRGNADPTLRTLVIDLRLPRALSAFATGGLLAMAGVLMQVLLRNPLADPYILGVSGGAATAALASIMVGISGPLLGFNAFAGALIVTWLVFALSRGSGGWDSHRLLLTGVVIAAGCGAIISVLLAIGTDTSLRTMVFWLLGDFSFADRPLLPWLVLAFALVAALVLAPALNILAHGHARAATLGIAVPRLRLAIYLLSSLVTAIAVTTAGTIGFVGLIVPHAIRLVTGSDHRIVLPASVLLGGSLLVVADTLARTVVAPRQLPVGALTALIGVPIFIYLMRRRSTS
ncbi:MAG: iron ABC transporter permease [Gammaproteobacteria bacterium]|nr:iron ABC transporter permease [Gammaproteobacteria bacterium]